MSRASRGRPAWAPARLLVASRSATRLATGCRRVTSPAQVGCLHRQSGVGCVILLGTQAGIDFGLEWCQTVETGTLVAVTYRRSRDSDTPPLAPGTGGSPSHPGT